MHDMRAFGMNFRHTCLQLSYLGAQGVGGGDCEPLGFAAASSRAASARGRHFGEYSRYDGGCCCLLATAFRISGGFVRYRGDMWNRDGGKGVLRTCSLQSMSLRLLACSSRRALALASRTAPSALGCRCFNNLFMVDFFVNSAWQTCRQALG